MNQSGLLALPAPRYPSSVRTEAAGFAVHLQDQIQTRMHGRLRNLQILFTDDGLVLKGRAPTYHVKQLVQHAVMAKCVTPIRANEIEVVRDLSRMPW